ncbi:FAD dependent oxidoreductase superfamily [Cryphonectria parasitica EP155]|uniref:FAD dependent oxidoreductase superfamily n=1 Tax=Cryphonectria parasitica (strain ATCC 38755 / EP155) TaxID=660469 RepID=A0A9P4Y9U0_CRYP1|nr:FAD dependent oxidoreductase superfamily [Cryphonectria parasitica EP155]KAF3769468.1 FAD dependent oxidoreductase superfamily [Cryphonectria parasitica EP155]
MSANYNNPGMLPVPNPTLSYWQSERHHLDSYRSTEELPSISDIVVIGAGIAGVSVVHHLCSTPDPPQILLLEARQTCSGATGRNGGHVKMKTASILGYIAKYGPASADEYARFVQDHIYALKDVVEKEKIACEFEIRRSYDVFNLESEAREVEASFREALDRGDQWTRDRDLVGPEFAEGLTSVKGARCAVSSPCCSLWPYKFVTALLERAMAKNASLNVQTETPVLKLDDGSDGVTLVHTPRGVVKAKKVVFATNAYTAALLPEYHGIITPYKGTAAHLAAEDGIEPVFPHLSHTYNLEFGLDPVLETVDYLNPRPDGGIVVGGAKWIYEEKRELWYNTVDDSTLFDPVIQAGYFDGYMQRNFKGWQDSGSRAESIWTGIMGSTPDGQPHVGKVPGKENQWILAGFNGGGNALTFLSAKAVARMVMEGVSLDETGG